MQLILQFNTEHMAPVKRDLLITRVTDLAEDIADELDGELVHDFVDYEEEDNNGGGDGMFWPKPNKNGSGD